MNELENLNNEYTAMVTALAKPGDQLLAELTPEGAHLLHMTVGLIGEVSELSLAFGDLYYNKAQYDRPNVIEELGDIEFYIEGLRQGLHIERDVTSVLIPSDRVGSVMYLTWLLGTMAGDVLDLVKKHAVYNKLISITKLTELLSRIEAVLAYIRNTIVVSREMVLEGNMSKLGVRYGSGKYENHHAQERLDKS